MVSTADFRRLLEVSRRWNENSGFPLNWFHQKCACVRRDCGAKRVDITKRNDLEPRREWTEAVAVLFVGGEANDRDRASMKIVGTNNNFSLAVGDALYFVAPLACSLHCGLNRFCAGVHGQSHIHASEFVKLLIEQRQLIISEWERG